MQINARETIFFIYHNIILIKNVHFRLGEYVSGGGLHDFVFAFLTILAFYIFKYSCNRLAQISS